MSNIGNQLRPITQRAANEIVYEQLHAAISSGKFAPGEKLSTRKIADQLNVSPMPVREAFHRLVAEGGLTRDGNRSMSIPVLSAKEYEEVTEVRLLLEGQAAANAATNHASKSELKKLSLLVNQLDQAVEDNERETHLTLNRKLHFGIYRLSGSETLVAMISQLWLRVGPLLRWNTTNLDTVLRSNTWHASMVQALIDHDADAARHAIEMDLTEAATVVLRNRQEYGM